MKYLLNHSIYSEGKYPSFVNFNPSDLLAPGSSSYSLLGIDPISEVSTFEDMIVSVNLPTEKLNFLASLGGSDALISTESETTRGIGIVDFELIPTPIRIGDTNLNNIYLESKDHSKYVKLTWMPNGEEIDSTRYYLSELGVDLSWFHYISYRDEEGIFKGNILEFCPLLLLIQIQADKNMSSVSWREVLDNMNDTLMLVRPKDDPIDFVWGKIDSSIKETSTDNLLLTPILFDRMAS